MIFSDRFYPTDIKTLLTIILKQLKESDNIVNIPKHLIFEPQNEDFFKWKFIGQRADSPIGVAAGPQTQMAQNIVAAWLAGARFIELKTVQTLDELEISKPCIDMQEEGYNCEWSQELKIEQSIDEYAKAWVLIHILAYELAFDAPNVIFNFSVGYNFEGISKPNVQWFFDNVTDSKTIVNKQIEAVKQIYPKIEKISIPLNLSNNVTLSTMHGCPPQEIEQIASYLISKRKLNTIVKLNPTLLGKEKLREIIKNTGFLIQVPDIAFEHDLKYPQAVELIKNLTQLAEKNNVFFGIKLTNTLESINNKDVFEPQNEMMYMSGKPLHLLAVNLAQMLQNEFKGSLNISFSAGVSAYNIVETLACGFAPVTICSDLLKPGGYAKLYQYFLNLRQLNKEFKSIEELILSEFRAKNMELKKAKIQNLNHYANKILSDNYYKKQGFQPISIKTSRQLGKFDCICAPCQDTCPTNQQIPQYLYFTQKKEFAKALKTILSDNPLPTITGYSCDHTCQTKCTRINYDQSLAIREIKRFVVENAHIDEFKPQYTEEHTKVAIVGGGPLGLSAAYYLSINGIYCEIFEKSDKLGGMTSKALPLFRMPDKQVDIDVRNIEKLVGKVHYEVEVDFEKFSQLTNQFSYVVIGAGAQKSLNIQIKGYQASGVWLSMDFFFATRQNQNIDLGQNVAVVGGGNTAIDAARIAKRLIPNTGKVTILYRRTKEFMPANYDEIVEAIAEGIEILELVEPIEFVAEQNKLKSIRMYRTKLQKQENSKRPMPVRVENSEFEMPFDSVIVAIGQQADLSFVNEQILKDLKLIETNDPKVFIGGDAIRGAASIIKAIADGKQIAKKIVENTGKKFKKIDFESQKYYDRKALKTMRVLQKFSNIEHKQLDAEPNNFELTSKTLTTQKAVEEASRCLMCDLMCDVCVSVCPNLANQSYRIENKQIKFPIVFVKGKEIVSQTKFFEIKQDYQVLNVADWCNECGNCATFCPTSGKPYTDKPKVHISFESFDNSPQGYYFDKTENVLTYKEKSKISKLYLGQLFDKCENDEFSAEINFLTGEVKNFEAKKSISLADFEIFAQIKVVSQFFNQIM